MVTTWRFASMSAICFSHPRASREADVGDINCNGNEVRQRRAVRISSIGAPSGRYLDSVEIPVVGAVVGGRNASGHRGAVIHPADRAVAVVRHAQPTVRALRSLLRAAGTETAN